MQRVIILFFAIIIMSFSREVYGQYLPIGILPMEYNPSFAGSVGNSRIVSNFSFYKDNLDDNRNYYPGGGVELSFDKYFPVIRSGVGVVLNGDHNSINWDTISFNTSSPSIELVIAPKFSIKGKYTLSPSISIKNTNYFSYARDSWHRYGHDFSSKLGLLFNATHYYIGYAAEYIYGRSGLTTAFQFGYTFQKSIDSKFSFTPQLALPIIIESGIYVFWPSYNLSFRYDSFIFGALSQFQYAYPTGFQIGWQNMSWRILVSNDFTDRYDANLTLRYIFNHDKKSRHILKSIY